MSKKKCAVAMFGVGVVTIPVLANLLARMGEEFDITVYSFIPVDKENIPRGIRIRAVPRFHMRIQYLVLGFRFLIDHFFSRYKILHAQSAFPGGVIARFFGNALGIPWMVTLIGGETEEIPAIAFGDLRNKKLRPITQRVCTEAYRLIVMSHEQAKLVQTHLRFERAIDVLPYAPECDVLPPRQIGSPLKLVHVSTYHPVKNYDMMLATIALVNKQLPVTVTIVGGNYDMHFLNKLTEVNLQDVIVMKGAQLHNDTLQIIREAHIMLHTSFYEGLPTVAFEAMANGVVVCGTRVGIIADLSEECCVAVDINDAERLATEIVNVAMNDNRYQRLRTQAHRWAAAHGPDFFVETLSVWYREATR